MKVTLRGLPGIGESGATVTVATPSFCNTRTTSKKRRVKAKAYVAGATGLEIVSNGGCYEQSTEKDLLHVDASSRSCANLDSFGVLLIYSARANEEMGAS